MMDKQLIFSEIESLIFDMDTLIKSLANSREYIAEGDYARATSKLSELEIEVVFDGADHSITISRRKSGVY